MLSSLLDAFGSSFAAIRELPHNINNRTFEAAAHSAQCVSKALNKYIDNHKVCSTRAFNLVSYAVECARSNLNAFLVEWENQTEDAIDSFSATDVTGALRALRYEVNLLEGWPQNHGRLHLVEPETDGSYIVRVLRPRNSDHQDRGVWIRMPAFREDGVRRQNVQTCIDRSYNGSVGRWELSNGETEQYADVLKDPAVTIFGEGRPALEEIPW